MGNALSVRLVKFLNLSTIANFTRNLALSICNSTQKAFSGINVQFKRSMILPVDNSTGLLMRMRKKPRRDWPERPQRVPINEQSDYLNFIVHFIGDLSQPLHACGRDQGGNNAKLHFDHSLTNLHSVWDTGILRKRMVELGLLTEEKFASYLLSKIKNGQFITKKWISIHPIMSVNHNMNSLAVIDWATDSDALNCEKVWGPYDSDPSQDFGAKYYDNVKDTIDLQLAKGGFRLADWLNKLFTSC